MLCVAPCLACLTRIASQLYAAVPLPDWLSGRRPFALCPDIDYDYDSDEDWEGWDVAHEDLLDGDEGDELDDASSDLEVRVDVVVRCVLR